jgi:hypothetical protein
MLSASEGCNELVWDCLKSSLDCGGGSLLLSGMPREVQMHEMVVGLGEDFS